MDKKLARALSISLGKYANDSTKKKKTIFGAKSVPAELKKTEKN